MVSYAEDLAQRLAHSTFVELFIFIAVFTHLKVWEVDWSVEKTLHRVSKPSPNMGFGFPICKTRRFEQIISHEPQL